MTNRTGVLFTTFSAMDCNRLNAFEKKILVNGVNILLLFSKHQNL